MRFKSLVVAIAALSTVSPAPAFGGGWRDLIETDPECVIELGTVGF